MTCSSSTRRGKSSKYTPYSHTEVNWRVDSAVLWWSPSPFHNTGGHSDQKSQGDQDELGNAAAICFQPELTVTSDLSEQHHALEYFRITPHSLVEPQFVALPLPPRPALYAVSNYESRWSVPGDNICDKMAHALSVPVSLLWCISVYQKAPLFVKMKTICSSRTPWQ